MVTLEPPQQKLSFPPPPQATITWPGQFTEEMEKEAGVIKATEIGCALVFKYWFLRILKQPETDRHVRALRPPECNVT